MLELEKAIEISLDLIKQLGSQTVDLINAAGRYNSSSLISKVDLPGFDNSAMDGYAIISSDLKQATESNPITFNMLDVDTSFDLRVNAGGPFYLTTNYTIIDSDTGETPSDNNSVIVV